MDKDVSLEAMHSEHVDGFEETRQLIKHKHLPPYGLSARYFVRLVRISDERGASDPLRRDGDESDEEYHRESKSQLLLSCAARKPPLSPASMSAKQRQRRKITSVETYNTSVKWMKEEDLTVWEVMNYWIK